MKKRLGAALAVGVLLLASCGEDSLSKSEFIAKGDASCKAFVDRVDPLFEKLFSGGGPDPAKIKELMPKVSAELGTLASELEGLSGPADGEKAVTEATAELREARKGIDAVVAEANKGNDDAGEKLFAAFDNFDEADKPVQAYGFKVCGAEEDDDEDVAPTDLPADQKAFVEQGEAICKETNEKASEVFGQLFGSANLEKKAEALAQLIPVLRAQNDALKALATPPAIAPQMKQITDAYDANLVQAEALIPIARSGDKAKYDAMFEELGTSFDAPNEAFGKLGFEECGD